MGLYDTEFAVGMPLLYWPALLDNHYDICSFPRWLRHIVLACPSIMTTALAYWLCPKLFLHNQCMPNQLVMLGPLFMVEMSCCLKVCILLWHCAFLGYCSITAPTFWCYSLISCWSCPWVLFIVFCCFGFCGHYLASHQIAVHSSVQQGSFYSCYGTQFVPQCLPAV